MTEDKIISLLEDLHGKVNFLIEVKGYNYNEYKSKKLQEDSWKRLRESNKRGKSS
jgi:hypothetical protein